MEKSDLLKSILENFNNETENLKQQARNPQEIPQKSIHIHTNKSVSEYLNTDRVENKDLKEIMLGITVFEQIVKNKLSGYNIDKYVLFVQWKYPEYTHVEIVEYLQSIGRLKPTKETKSDNQQTSSNYLVIKALKDIPAFVGCDTQRYKINIGDVVSIPQVNAIPFIKRKVVVEVSDQTQGKSENTGSLHIQKVEKYFTEVWQRNHGPVNSINLVRFCMDCALHLKITTEEVRLIAIKLFAITPKQPPENVQPLEKAQPSEKDQDYVLVKTAEEVDRVVKSLKEGGF